MLIDMGWLDRSLCLLCDGTGNFLYISISTTTPWECYACNGRGYLAETPHPWQKLVDRNAS
jgi:hypothetical protein